MIKFCSLYSGSSGNCIFVGTDKTRILVDAGLSGSTIVHALQSIGENPQDIDAILITHEHSDHIRGVGILSRKYDIPVYANLKTWMAIDESLGKFKDKNKRIIGKVSAKPMQCSLLEVLGEECEEEYVGFGTFEIGDIGVSCSLIPHDAAEPVCYSFFANDKKISVATDIGHVTDSVRQQIAGSDLILIESNHDVEKLKKGSYPWPLKRRILGEYGHLSNETCAALVADNVKQGTRRVFLGHLSQENNIPELAYEASAKTLQSIGAVIGKDVFLSVADRNKVGEVTLL